MKDGNGYFVLLAVYRYASCSTLEYMVFDNTEAFVRWRDRLIDRKGVVISTDWRFVHV